MLVEEGREVGRIKLRSLPYPASLGPGAWWEEEKTLAGAQVERGGRGRSMATFPTHADPGWESMGNGADSNPSPSLSSAGPHHHPLHSNRGKIWQRMLCPLHADGAASSAELPTPITLSYFLFKYIFCSYLIFYWGWNALQKCIILMESSVRSINL